MRNALLVNSTGNVGGAERILSTFLKRLDKNAFRFFAIVPSRGGFSGLLRELGIDFEVAEGLYEKGFVTRDGGVFEKPALTTHSVGNIFRFSAKISKCVERKKIDILISNGVKASISAGLAARRNKKPSIWIIQDILPDNLFRKFFFLCARAFSDRIIVISDSIRKTFPEYLMNKTILIPPFLEDEELQKSGEANAHHLREALFIEDDEVVLGLVGKLIKSKGIDMFFDIFARLKKKNRRIRALIAGDAELEAANSDYADELKGMVKLLDIEDSVLFTGWHDDIYNVLPAVDILVHVPTRPEGFGRVMIEAMACRKTVVAFGYGAAAEIIEDGISGILVEPLNRESLFEKLNTIIQDSEGRKTLGEEARRRVETHFSERDARDELNDILKEFFNQA